MTASKDTPTTPEIDYDLWPHAKGHEKDVVQGDDGGLHYRKNVVIRWLLDFGNINLDQIWTTFETGAFSIEDMMEFYRLIGYRLEGFEEIWHRRDPATRDSEDDEETDG